jgi:hypothetical protein
MIPSTTPTPNARRAMFIDAVVVHRPDAGS